MPRKDAKAHSVTPSIVEHNQPFIADDQSERVRFQSYFHLMITLLSLLSSLSQPFDQDHDSTTNETPGVIILHPGSSTLRLGLSTQLSPNTVPHLIAYRKEGARSQEQRATPTSALDIGLSLRCNNGLTVRMCLHTVEPKANTINFILIKIEYRELVLWSHYVDYISGIQYVSIIDGRGVPLI